MHQRRDNSSPWRQRYDRGELLPAVRRADGTMLLQGFACREGVLEYAGPDGRVWRELVPLQTLEDSAGGLARLAVTLEHPDTDVTPENVGELGVGDTGSFVRLEEGGFVRVEIAVRKADAIEAIDAGKRELSPGYLARVEETAGVHPIHGAYDAIQLERRYNHLAIVDAARGGPEIRLRADGARSRTLISRAQRDSSTPAQRTRMNPGLIALLAQLGITQRCDSDDAGIAILQGHLAQRKDAADKAATDHKAELERLRTEHQQKLDAATKATADEKKRADELDLKVKALEKEKRDTAEEELMKELDGLAGKLKVDKSKYGDMASLKQALADAYMGGRVADSEVEGVLAVARKAAKDMDAEPPPEEEGEDMPPEGEEEPVEAEDLDDEEDAEPAPRGDSRGSGFARGQRAWTSTMKRSRDRQDRQDHDEQRQDRALSSSELYAQHSRKAFEAARSGGRGGV